MSKSKTERGLPKEKPGPKIKTVDWKEFDKLCHFQCTLREIAFFFEMSEDTIENIVKREKDMKFSEYYQQRAVSGKIDLRRKQFQAALKGNTALLIWLGKQYLGQSEKVMGMVDEGANEEFRNKFFGIEDGK